MIQTDTKYMSRDGRNLHTRWRSKVQTGRNCNSGRCYSVKHLTSSPQQQPEVLSELRWWKEQSVNFSLFFFLVLNTFIQLFYLLYMFMVCEHTFTQFDSMYVSSGPNLYWAQWKNCLHKSIHLCWKCGSMYMCVYVCLYGGMYRM